jgi:flavin reductase (DIM6/NTAB) family NADH-FMN oxidoreductase RutF
MMDIDLSTLQPPQIYGLLSQAVIPRPIAWVLSDNGDGSLNLAPFSYFTPVCSNPPLIMLSIGWKDAQTPKDTRFNIEQRSEFVIHIAHRELLEPMNDSSAVLEHGESEVEQLGLETTPFEGSRLPRLKDARAALACTRYRVMELGPKKQGLILGQVHRFFLADDLVTEEDGRYKIDAARLDPVTRLGLDQYATLADIVNLPRPT